MKVRRYQARSQGEKMSKSLDLIAKKIYAGSARPAVRLLALRAVASAPERNERAEIAALADFVKRRVKFRRDPYAIEMLGDIEDMLEQGAGDCDCMTIGLGQLMASIGYPVRARAIGDTKLRHVFPEVYLKSEGRWMPVDLTKPGDPYTMPAARFPMEAIVYPTGQGPGYYRARKQENLGSWLSEGINKVVGKKTGKALEKGVKDVTRIAGQTVKAVSSVIPVVGPAVSKFVDIGQASIHLGEDPAKMSWTSIADVAASDPAAGQELAALKTQAEALKSVKAGKSDVPDWPSILAMAPSNPELALQLGQARYQINVKKGKQKKADTNWAQLQSVVAQTRVSVTSASSLAASLKSSNLVPIAVAIGAAYFIFSR